jgi:hypothetical protein
VSEEEPLGCRPVKNAAERFKPGDFVYVRYHDHVFFKDVDESVQTPRILTAHGLLSYQDDQFIRLRFEDYEDHEDHDPSSPTRVRSMGLVIVRSTIVEIRKVTA